MSPTQERYFEFVRLRVIETSCIMSSSTSELKASAVDGGAVEPPADKPKNLKRKHVGGDTEAPTKEVSPGKTLYFSEEIVFAKLTRHMPWPARVFY